MAFNPEASYALYLEDTTDVNTLEAFISKSKALSIPEYQLVSLAATGLITAVTALAAPADKNVVWLKPTADAHDGTINIYNPASEAWETASMELFALLLNRLLPVKTLEQNYNAVSTIAEYKASTITEGELTFISSQGFMMVRKDGVDRVVSILPLTSTSAMKALDREYLVGGEQVAVSSGNGANPSIYTFTGTSWRRTYPEHTSSLRLGTLI